METNQTGFDVLEKSLKTLEDRKIANKALKDINTELTRVLSVDIGLVKKATKLIEKHKAGWASTDSPLILKQDAEVKDEISQLFIKLRDIIETLRMTGNEDILKPYLTVLSNGGIDIQIQPSDTSKPEEAQELFKQANSYIRTIRDYDNEIRQEHALEADNINFCPTHEYKSLLNIFKKGIDKGPESIEDSYQDKQLKLEMAETAYNLVYDKITSL